MKKKLSQAIAAAALLGAAGAAQAVEVSHGGEGQALLFPYYTVEDGNYTALHVTNTTDQYKAVKVRFRRSTDSADVLDFNLYLSPQDMWTAGVVANENGDPKLVSGDTSCISAFPDGLPADGQRFGVVTDAKKGHVEIIEMASWTREEAGAAIVTGNITVADAVEHKEADANGIRKPGNCAAINATWRPGGNWADSYKAGVAGNTLTASFADTHLGQVPKGGLYGNAYVINPDQAWASSFAPVALDALHTGTLNNHHSPRFGLPDLQGPEPVIDLLVMADPEWGTVGQQEENYLTLVNLNNAGMADFPEIVAALSKATIKSDFTLGAGIDASTELVVTFPLKYAGQPARGSEVEIGAVFYDREENRQVAVEEDFQLSPWLPEEGVSNSKLVHETNIVHLGTADDRQDIGVATLNLSAPYSEGWVDISFVNELVTTENDDGEPVVTTTPIAGGVPVIGYTSTIVKNSAVLENGATNTYAHSFPLKYTEAE